MSSPYLAIARKWRPHRFEDLVGQLHVVQTLKNSILLNRVSHAYLFGGARGIGKTSVARIFAKALRCPNAKEAVPCNTCEECVAISESRSVDVAEIDGASNNGVEAVRSIRDNVAYSASSGSYKIYIIDEVHMLSLSAFNALLKTLEEPPAHVIFIMATTEVQKIPLTILSRCQRFEFRRLNSQEIADRLLHILKAEGIQIQDEGLRTIATAADGSLRDALSLLDQVLSFFGEEGKKRPLENKEVVEALGISDSNMVLEYWESLLKQDLPRALKLIGEVYLAGVDLKHFAERCLEELRLLYLIAVMKESSKKSDAAATTALLDISPVHFANLESLLPNASVLKLERMAQIFSKAISQLSWASLPRFVLEMATVRMTELEKLEEIEKQLLEGGVIIETAPAPAQNFSQPMTQSAPAPRVMSTPQAPAPAPMTSGPGGPPPSVMGANVDSTWKGFVDNLMKKRPLLGALLTHANFKIDNGGEGKVVNLAFEPGTFYDREAIDQKRDITEHVKSYFGKETVVILSNEVKTTSPSIEAERSVHIANVKKTALAHPSVQQMKEVLGADVVDIQVDA